MSDNNVSKPVYSDRPGMVNSVGLSRQLADLKKKKKALQERYAIEGLQRDLYDKFLAKLDTQITALREQFEEPRTEIPNLKNSLDKAIDFSQNVSKY